MVLYRGYVQFKLLYLKNCIAELEKKNPEESNHGD